MTTADAIRTAVARLIGYTVQGHGFNKQHHTLTRSAALSWAACYPAATITRAGQFIATKTTGA
jgi:hypothetical protein